MNILMVCLGNICRSPMAEGVMQEKYRKYGITGKVDSAGVISFHSGEKPDNRAIEMSSSMGIDISSQLARQFKTTDFQEFDLILTMDKSVHKEIVNLAGDEKQARKVQLFLPFAGIQNPEEVPDPYYGGRAGFEKVFSLIDDGCERIISKIKS